MDFEVVSAIWYGSPNFGRSLKRELNANNEGLKDSIRFQQYKQQTL